MTAIPPNRISFLANVAIRVFIAEVVDSTYLYLGADNGLLIYNYRTDTYEEPGIDFPTDIRTLVMYDGLLWLGTLNGLYTYHPQTREVSLIRQFTLLSILQTISFTLVPIMAVAAIHPLPDVLK